MSALRHPPIRNVDGSLDFRRPGDRVYITTRYGWDVAGTRYLALDGLWGRFDRAGVWLRTEAEAMLPGIPRGPGDAFHLHIAESESEIAEREARLVAGVGA